MKINNKITAEKLRRWEKYLNNYNLPCFEQIPDIGLYMEQVITYMEDLLDYLPPELKKEQFITAATINNYVRRRIIPKPVKKRYYRKQLAFIIIVCSLKQCININLITKLIPCNLTDNEINIIYNKFQNIQKNSINHFMDQIRLISSSILNHKDKNEITVSDPEGLIFTTTIESGLYKLLSEKLLLLDKKIS